jgi:hypothetical protein
MSWGFTKPACHHGGDAYGNRRVWLMWCLDCMHAAEALHTCSVQRLVALEVFTKHACRLGVDGSRLVGRMWCVNCTHAAEAFRRAMPSG